MNINGQTPGEQEIIDRVVAAGQGHVFRFWAALSSGARQRLLLQLSSFDFDLLSRLYKQAAEKKNDSQTKSGFEPAKFHSLPKTASELQAMQAHRQVGEKSLRAGRVAAFLVAGGQGSRLGFEGPKGIFPVTPVKRKSLFQLHAEKILALSRRYDVAIPWYIMTSESNHDATIEFFKEHRYFGLPESKVSFFRQEMIPALDEDGRLFLTAKDHVFTNPNGHGGSLSALKKSGALAEMKKDGVDLIFYFQLDNVLANICDPVFLGLHIQNSAEMSAKVVLKEDPNEKIGIVGKIDGRYGVIEYSDFSDEEKHARDADGTLKFNAGSIAIHIFNVDFVERENHRGLQLPWHIAHKRIPFVDDAGNLVNSQTPNGYKFETFVFDALRDAKKVLIMEVDRAQEFSPVKNAQGVDSPQTAVRDMNSVFGTWLENAGISVQRDAKGNVKANIEISPLYALDENALMEKIDPKLDVKDSLYLG